MSKLMLIDAVHQEETRVALVNNGRVEDFDFETTGSEQLRGNIYLAKVTRVEPSLQACFVEYGGNRHGFLAFSEIHPDYYQLPQADREALLEEAAREAERAADEDPEDDDDDEIDAETDSDDDNDDPSDEQDEVVDDAETDEADEEESEDDATAETDDEQPDDATSEEAETAADESDEDDEEAEKPKAAAKPERRRRGARKSRGTSITRRYKIQEVIRRRQVLLVQVVKEERGNKGAALTTYLSLAGRYSVLMPNTPRGGGISRKIPNGNDRKRLKAVMDDLEVPKGMGLIVRTAGAKRTKSEIRRDYDYLQKLWAKIRSKTMESVAPARIHEEGGLVHRAMRDMFDREIEEVVVQGDAAYREAKDLAKTLMPTQARKVKRWTAQAPLFVKEGVEEQLDSIFSPTVSMKSGGYLVINQTEALVAIDVNSGKSTKERNIEQTALHTNLEAAEEACRQMRLRDLAGLVVIDFIDMDENKNNRAVERKMKDALKLDRARVQNNRISQFGLMEISRQRRRAGVLQATSEKCDACDGTGRRRSIPSSALQLLRAIEARAAGGGLRGMTVTAPTDVALYLLNSKRDLLSAIEEEAGYTIAIKSSASMIPGDFEIDAEKTSSGRRRRQKFNRADFLEGDEDDHLLPEAEDDEDDDVETSTASEEDDEDSNGRRKRRRRGRRGGRRRRKEMEVIDPGAPPSDGGALLDGLALSVTNLLGDEPEELPPATDGGLEAKPVAMPAARPQPAEAEATSSEETGDEQPKEGKKRRRRRRRKRRGEGAPETAEANTASETTEAAEEADTPEEVPAVESEITPATEDAPASVDEDPPVKLVAENEQPVEISKPVEQSDPEPVSEVAPAPEEVVPMFNAHSSRLAQPALLPDFDRPFGLPVFRSVAEAIDAYDGDDAIYVLYPQRIAAAAEQFLDAFPGKTLYAVKANPHPAVLKTLWASGVRAFDVASIREIDLVADACPDAEQYLMHPVKSRRTIRHAYAAGIRHFAFDCAAELGKILVETNDAADLHLHLRLALPTGGSASMPLDGKYGATYHDAVELLRAARPVAARLGVCFHVGSQCMDPADYISALSYVHGLLEAANVRIDSLDCGGGFPVAYPGLTPPPMQAYFDRIAKGLDIFGFSDLEIIGEPGRALCGEACPDGGEIGRAQALQARAAGLSPHTDMNPVLLKPETDRAAQVVVHGKALTTMQAADYMANRDQLMDAVISSFERLKRDNDLVIVEGAGSPAEVNLRDRDIANMGFARRADVPVCLIGDIDKGGVIASLVGTQAVISPDDAAMIKGFIVNKFRGDPSLFEDGVHFIEQRTNWPCFGVVPWVSATARLPAEDAVTLQDPTQSSDGVIKIAAPMLSRIANFDDADPLRLEPGVAFEWVPPGQTLPRDADLIILFGTKSTLGDLAFLRDQGGNSAV
eukprot:g3246.t1